ncbi:MAG: acetate uptake transporter [Flavobacteriales bacterium AspAUS03]
MDIRTMRDSTSNVASLGLLGLGMILILLSLQMSGLYKFNIMVIGTGVFMRSIAQLITGIQLWKKGRTFDAAIFIAYGLI